MLLFDDMEGVPTYQRLPSLSCRGMLGGRERGGRELARLIPRVVA